MPERFVDGSANDFRRQPAGSPVKVRIGGKLITSAAGETITTGEIYMATPDGKPNLNWACEVIVLDSEYQWRAEWNPVKAGWVELAREDNGYYGYPWMQAKGLLAVCAIAVNGQFRTIQLDELRAAAANLSGQLNRRSSPAHAWVEVPHGYTVAIVAPELVYGTRASHSNALLAVAGAKPEQPGR